MLESYVSLRQWGTVRKDYSANGDAWGSLAMFGGNSNGRGPIWFRSTS